MRRERRQRAEARLRLRLVRDAAMLVAHRGGPRFDSQSKFVRRLCLSLFWSQGCWSPPLVLWVPSSIFMSLLSHPWLVLLQYLVMSSGINLSRWKS